MAWNQSLIAGPWPIPVYGAPVTDPMTGAVSTPITGTAPGYCLVVQASFVTPELKPYVQAVPPGVPVLEGVQSAALVFADEAAARKALPGFWSDPLV